MLINTAQNSVTYPQINVATAQKLPLSFHKHIFIVVVRAIVITRTILEHTLLNTRPSTCRPVSINLQNSLKAPPKQPLCSAQHNLPSLQDGSRPLNLERTGIPNFPNAIVCPKQRKLLCIATVNRIVKPSHQLSNCTFTLIHSSLLLLTIADCPMQNIPSKNTVSSTNG